MLVINMIGTIGNYNYYLFLDITLKKKHKCLIQSKKSLKELTTSYNYKITIKVNQSL